MFATTSLMSICASPELSLSLSLMLSCSRSQGADPLTDEPNVDHARRLAHPPRTGRQGRVDRLWLQQGPCLPASRHGGSRGLGSGCVMSRRVGLCSSWGNLKRSSFLGFTPCSRWLAPRRASERQRHNTTERRTTTDTSGSHNTHARQGASPSTPARSSLPPYFSLVWPAPLPNSLSSLSTALPSASHLFLRMLPSRNKPLSLTWNRIAWWSLIGAVMRR